MRSIQNSSRGLALPAAPELRVVWAVLIVVAALITITGCGFSGSATAFTSPIAIGGSVHGGRQPVSGSRIQLYAAGISGTGSAAQPLLSSPVESDSYGKFSIPATYHCPSPSAQIYLVARGGNPGLSSGTNNKALALAAVLGSCNSLSASPISVNEVTTVGSVWPLAQYMTGPTDVGSAVDDTSFLSAVSSVPELVNLAEGSSPGTPKANSFFAESAKLYNLADVLANCVSSSGGTAGDGSPCGALFSMATPAGGSAPTDTITAAMRIAQSPHSNVVGIFGLAAGGTPFQPTLSAAPADWTLSLSSPVVATPSLSLGTGTYVGKQQVSISDSTAGSTIYYSTDGTVPTSSSPSYAGAISIAATATVQAIAVLNGSQSAVASSTLTITGKDPIPVMLAFVEQPSNSVANATISPAVRVAVEDASGNTVVSASDPVTLALVGGTGLAGTLTVSPHNGIATFSNLSVNTAGTGLTLLATGPQLSFVNSTTFSISAPGSGTVSTPAKLAFSQQPTNALTQAAITPAVQVTVEDAGGNTVTSATNPVTLSLLSGTGLAGALTVTPQNGVATFSNLTVSTAGSGYTLFATSPNLTSATSATFTISAPGTAAPTVAVAVTPATVSVTTGATQQFAASITGTSNTAVTWTASGTGCSGTTCGTISSTGRYTAPATAPSPATVTITATSVSDPSKSASAAVSIVPSAGTSQPLACSGTQPAPTTAPTQAAAAGFNTLVFDDEFNSPNTISPNNEGHYNWYTWNVYGTSKELSSADYEVSNGCLTIFTDLTGSGADLQTVNSGTATTGLFQYGYFEARIQFNPTGSEGGGSWPAFWSDALQSIPEISPFAELDFMEAVPNGKGGATTGSNGVTIITTAHQWTKGNGWNDTYNTNNIPPVPASFNYDAFHIYGCLWSPSSVTWYIDNQPVMTVAIGPGTELTAIEQDQLFLILGTGKNWPTTFDYVRVWH